MNCVNCKKNNIELLDKYKMEIDQDVKYLGEMSIFKCNDCHLAFCYPMPSNKKLDYFYSKIYRDINRPHHYDEYYKKYSYLDNINLDYLSYLTTHIDFNKINAILDFGAGIGNLGYSIKQYFNHIKLYSIESDEHCLETLKYRGYKNWTNFEEINIKFDLIISLHSLEHLTDLKPLHKLNTLLNNDGYLFIEVPNCDFDNYYKKRVFDSPHLLFFNIKSLENIFLNMQLKKINLIYSSYNIETDIQNQQASKLEFSKLNILKKFLKLLKKYSPLFILKLLRIYYKLKAMHNSDVLKWHVHSFKNTRCLRSLLQKKS
tara:strand:- start:51 stop:998 length:948 start_codon:yes stop_codon:yes gene_type:complete